MVWRKVSGAGISCLVLSNSLRPVRLFYPWDSPGRNTGVGSFSRGSSQPRDWTQVSCIVGRFFTVWATRGVHCQGQEMRRIRLWGRTADQTWSTETQLWLILQPLVSLVLRHWWTPGLLAQIQLLDLQCWTDLGWVHAGLQLCLEGPSSWRSLICLPPGTAKCPLGICMDPKVQFSPCDAKGFLL